MGDIADKAVAMASEAKVVAGLSAWSQTGEV